MSTSHQDKYLTKLLIGISLIIAGIFVIFYHNFELTDHEDWYIWALISAAVLIVGLMFMGSAFVHKIKSDLIRRQKQREAKPASKTAS
jgi:hypothetical protein